MTTQLHDDRPISHPRDDALGLTSFADALATSLLQMSPRDGLVISVEGPWGAGKSSAISLALRTIKLRVLQSMGEGQVETEQLTPEQIDAKWSEKAKNRKTHIVRFNPWHFSGQENLVRAFFDELAAQIDVVPDGALKRAMNRLGGFLPSVGGALAAAAMLATGNVPGAGPAATSRRRVFRTAYQVRRLARRSSAGAFEGAEGSRTTHHCHHRRHRSADAFGNAVGSISGEVLGRLA
jgi:hypothetical protein